MTNQVAIGLALVLLALLGLSLLLDTQPLVFLGRKFLDLIGWLAFWR